MKEMISASHMDKFIEICEKEMRLGLAHSDSYGCSVTLTTVFFFFGKDFFERKHVIIEEFDDLISRTDLNHIASNDAKSNQMKITLMLSLSVVYGHLLNCSEGVGRFHTNAMKVHNAIYERQHEILDTALI